MENRDYKKICLSSNKNWVEKSLYICFGNHIIFSSHIFYIVYKIMKKSLAVLVVCCGLLVVPTLASTGVCAPGTSGSKCEIKKEIETLKTGYKQALSAVK